MGNLVYLLDRSYHDVGARLVGHAGCVGADYDVVKLQQRVIKRRRFGIPYIQPCARNLFVSQRLGQRLLVVHAPARRRHKICTWFHTRVGTCVKYPLGTRVARAVHGDEIRLPQQRIEVRLLGPSFRESRGFNERVKSKHAHI